MTISINGVNQAEPSIEDYGGAVQDIAALKIIGPSERFDTQRRYVEDETRPYHFDLQSVAAESLPTVVEPSDSPAAGRWIRMPPEAGGLPAVHAFAGAEHSASTLASVNGKITDATLIDTGDARLSDDRDPNAHDLAGADHNAATLATLNAKISDATLIDTGDARLSDDRDPNAHDLAGADHNAATLAALNAKISDATLIDTGDARLSDDRDPNAHATEHVDGTDDIQNATAAQKGLATAAQIGKLDGIEALADVTDAVNVNAAGAVMHTDVGGAALVGRLKRTAGETYDTIKDNVGAVSGPGVGDDNLDGYEVGSIWVDTNNDRAFIAVDVSTGAAIWHLMGGEIIVENFIPLHDFLAASGSPVLVQQSGWLMWRFDDTADEAIEAAFPLPGVLSATKSMVFSLYHAAISAQTTKVVRWNNNVKFLSVGDAISVDERTVNANANVAVPDEALQIQKTDIIVTLAGNFGANDQANLTIKRNGASGSDTVVGDMGLVGVAWQYTIKPQ